MMMMNDSAAKCAITHSDAAYARKCLCLAGTATRSHCTEHDTIEGTAGFGI